MLPAFGASFFSTEGFLYWIVCISTLSVHDLNYYWSCQHLGQAFSQLLILGTIHLHVIYPWSNYLLLKPPTFWTNFFSTEGFWYWVVYISTLSVLQCALPHPFSTVPTSSPHKCSTTPSEPPSHTGVRLATAWWYHPLSMVLTRFVVFFVGGTFWRMGIYQQDCC